MACQSTEPPWNGGAIGGRAPSARPDSRPTQMLGLYLHRVEERQHPLAKQCRRRGVVCRERGIGEEMLVARVEEQLGPVSRGHECLRCLEVLSKEWIGRLAVHLDRDAVGPRVPKLRYRQT